MLALRQSEATVACSYEDQARKTASKQCESLTTLVAILIIVAWHILT